MNHSLIIPYADIGMPPLEISETLGIPLSRVYRSLEDNDSGRCTLHYFPDMDSTVSDLCHAEQHRQYVSEHFHPSKEALL